MPYVNIKITRTDPPATPAQKAELIKGATDLLQRVLNKNPATTFVIVEEVETDNWGVAGQSVTARNATPKS
jgi:4-oxalocrotonate tautomerase